MNDEISKPEIGKDAVQSAVEATASTVGEVATIITGAVGQVAKAIGDLGTELFEITEASRKASED